MIANFVIVADAAGEVALCVPGNSALIGLVFQCVFLDPSVSPHNVAFSNAILAQFGR